MKAKQVFLEQAAKRQKAHPKTAPKIVSFSLAVVFFSLSIILGCTTVGMHFGDTNFTKSMVELILDIFTIIFLQGAVVTSALGVTSTRYTLHVVCCVILSISLVLDILFLVYFFLLAL